MRLFQATRVHIMSGGDKHLLGSFLRVLKRLSDIKLPFFHYMVPNAIERHEFEQWVMLRMNSFMNFN